jgi:hypothetical protein
MREVDFNKWLCEKGFEAERNTIFGDCKSIEVYAAFKNDIKARGHILSDASIQLNEFEKALATVQTLPGDWHTGLNMLQSTFKTYCKLLLDPSRDMLDWKRVNDEVKCCYYQASRLVKLPNDELHRFTMKDFVSKHWETYCPFGVNKSDDPITAVYPRNVPRRVI